MVFRPYAHLTPSSCTSERLEASSKLSSTFTSNRHSSLSFGSHNHISSPSTHNAIMISLVRVSRRVKSHFLLPSTFSFFILPFFTFRSLYFSAIGHHAIFSLGSPSPPNSHCTTKQSYSLTQNITPTGISPSQSSASHRSSASTFHSQLAKRQLPSGLIPVHSPLLRKS